MKVYCAHAISGLSGEEVISYYENITEELSKLGCDVYYPMIAKGYFRPEKEFKAHGYEGKPVSSNHAIYERDTWMVSMCDILFLDLTNTKNVSIGSIMELALASHCKKHTIVVMEENNIHQHCFVIEAADIIFNNIANAKEYLQKLIKRST